MNAHEEHYDHPAAAAAQTELFDELIPIFLHGTLEDAAQVGARLAGEAHTVTELAAVFCRFATIASCDLRRIAGPALEIIRATHQGFFAVDPDATLDDNETIVNQLVVAACNDDVEFLFDQATAAARLPIVRAHTILAVLGSMTRQQHRSFCAGQL